MIISHNIHITSVVKAEKWRGAAIPKIDAERYTGAKRELFHDTDIKTKNYIINKWLIKYWKNIFSISINEKLKIINFF